MSIFAILIVGFLAQQTRPSSLDGIVVRAGTDQPIVRAVVELSGDKSERRVVATGADGRFDFQNITPGRYRLTVSRSGYLDGAYGKRGLNGKGTDLIIDGGQRKAGLRLTMIELGAISGRVYDANGEPIANVPVQALRYSYADGQRTLTPVKTAQSNDRGEYRLFWLTPAQYYINAMPPSGSRGAAVFIGADGVATRGSIAVWRIPSDAEKLGEADVPVFYPGTADPQSAVAVDLAPGADIAGVDFTLSRSKTYRVRGVGVDSVTGQLATAASFTLVSRNPPLSGPSLSRPTSDGAFAFEGVLPGSYFLLATQRMNTADSGVKITSGRLPIDIGGSDLDRVTIVLSTPLEISGTFTIEGSSNNEFAPGDYPVVSLKDDLPTTTVRFTETYADIKGNKLVVDNVTEGDYRVHVALPSGAYVKSIRYGSADALNESLHIDSRSRDRLDIVISMNAGTLAGVVVDQNHQAVANAPVALVPDATHRQRADLYRSAYTDDFGRFNLKGIAPGNYSLFAWEDVEDGFWQDPEFIRRQEAFGKTIRFVESARENVELTAIPFAY